MNYTIKRSNRKTIGLQMTPEGLLIRAPRRATTAEIERAIEKNRRWILTHEQKLAREIQQARQEGLLSPEELHHLTVLARKHIPQRVAHYAPLIGVHPGRISIRTQKTRWGSCSSKGNLNFNCLLMLTPPEVIDSIVVHELCHLKQMNHSRDFYRELYRAYPEYDKWHRWLKTYGGTIMKRAGF